MFDCKTWPRLLGFNNAEHRGRLPGSHAPHGNPSRPALQAVANNGYKRLDLDATHPECIPMRRMGTRKILRYAA